MMIIENIENVKNQYVVEYMKQKEDNILRNYEEGQDMIGWACENCRKETDHQIKETEMEGYQDYKILICQVCGEKEMVPEHVIEKQEDDSLKVNWEALESTE